MGLFILEVHTDLRRGSTVQTERMCEPSVSLFGINFRIALYCDKRINRNKKRIKEKELFVVKRQLYPLRYVIFITSKHRLPLASRC